jgi:mevalonate kinase
VVQKHIKASAPASIMLFGEHSVLRGGKAIVAAIDTRISVTITPQEEKVFLVESSLGKATTPIHSISLGHTFRFIEKSLFLFEGSFPSGAVISVSSDIDHTIGLGSSAAVTVATLAAVYTWLNFPYNKYDLLARAIEVIRMVQGCGSGADASSIIWGGVISYSMKKIKKLQSSCPLVLVYSGKKTPTPEVIAYVNELEKQFPESYALFFAAIEQCVCDAEKAFKKKDWNRVGALMNMSQGLMEALCVGTNELSRIFWDMKKIPSLYGAKISGSGLGDCVVGLGEISDEVFEKRIPIRVSPQGVVVHSYD